MMNKLKKAQSGKRTTRKKQKYTNKKTKRGGATEAKAKKKKIVPLRTRKPVNKNSPNGGNENPSVNLSPPNNNIIKQESNLNSNSSSQVRSLTSSGRSGNEGETKIPPTTLYLGLAGLIVAGIAGIVGGVL